MLNEGRGPAPHELPESSVRFVLGASSKRTSEPEAAHPRAL